MAEKDAEPDVARSAISTPVTLRNSRVGVALLLLLACFSFVTAPCLAILALTELFPLKRLSFDRVYGVLSWAVAAGFSVTAGYALWQIGRTMASNQVRLASDGVHFRLNSKKRESEIFFTWTEITRITHKRTNNTQIYSVFGQGDRVISFTSYTFLRPKHVGRKIAAYGGKTVTEV